MNLRGRLIGFADRKFQPFHVPRGGLRSKRRLGNATGNFVCCRGLLFNRDRKSQPLTVGPQGWMQAGGAKWMQAHGDGALTLGAWMAISGAAFAPAINSLLSARVRK